ncbi:MAG: RHS repeat protein, partial [Planctomycetes bacterium]|nr:RHS repeat protein [Planctomycetota bacterium]
MDPSKLRTLLSLLLIAWLGTGPILAQDPQETPEDGTSNPVADDADNHDESAGDEDGEDSEGDPIDVSSGAFRYSKTVLSRPGRGMDFNFDLKYLSSAWTIETNTAARWTHNFEQKIVLHVTKGAEITPYPGPVDTVGSPYQVGGDAPGDGRTGGGGGGGAEPGGGGGTSEPLYPLHYKIFHYHNLKIDRYFKDPSDYRLWNGQKGLFKKIWLTYPGGTGPASRIPITMTMRAADGTIAVFDLREGGDCYGLPYQQGSTSTFVYRPSQIIDRHGNTFDLNYETLTRPSQCPTLFPWSSYRRLIGIVDTFGMLTTLDYDAGGWLETITGPTGRTVTLEHDTIGNLTAFSMPPIATEPSRWVVEYSSKVTGMPNSGHNVERIIAPNEVNDGSNTPYVENIYDDTLEFRVVRQIYGGINSSGVSAGGMHDFIYEFQPQFPTQQLLQHPWFGEKSRTLTVDPNGNVELKIYDGDDRLRLIYKFTGRLNHLVDPQNPPSISSLVAYDVGWSTPAGPHAFGNILTPDEATIGSFETPTGAYVTRRDYNGDNLMSKEISLDDITEYEFGSSSTDRFQDGNLVVVRKISVDDPADVIERAFSYEPYFNQRWVDYDPRGLGTHVPPNGGTNSADRYSVRRIFDFQEGGNTFGGLVAVWEIDTTQALQTTTLTSLGVSNPGTVSFNLGDQNGDGNTSQNYGNVIAIESTAQVYVDATQPGLGFGSQVIRNERRFNDYSNVTHIIDPLGNESEQRFYPGSDPFGLNSSVPTTTGSGRLALIVAPESVQRAFEYDALGRQTLETDPRGFPIAHVFDDQNHVVMTIDALGETTSWSYDANSHLLARSRQYFGPELDANGLPTGTRILEGLVAESWTYDLLGNELTYTRTSDTTGQTKTRQFRYDRNQNRVATLTELWTPGSGHLSTCVFDELDRLYTETQGGVTSQFASLSANADAVSSLGLASTGLETTKTTLYEGSEKARRLDGKGQATIMLYDGFGRMTTERDPLGNEVRRVRDLADNVIEISHFGDDGAGNLVTLARRQFLHDESSRVFSIEADHFRLDTGSIGDGISTSRTLFDAASNPVQQVDDLGAVTLNEYDDLNRLETVTDPVGNSVAYVRDANGNIIRATSTELHGDGTSQLFVTLMFYDPLNRMVARTSPGNETSRYAYDSLGLIRFQSDARSANLSVGLSSLDTYGEHSGLAGRSTNDHGNTTTRTYDFDGRELTRRFSLRTNGLGTLAETSAIVNSRTYDLEGRVKTRTDGRNHTTQYDYDDLGRLTLTTYADGTFEQYVVYDDNHNLLGKIDARGNVVVNFFDELDRLESRAITKAPGTIGSNFEQFEYDGMSRVVSAANNDATVWRAYDSLSKVVREEIGFGSAPTSGVISQFDFDGNGNLTSIAYPGGRNVSITRDALGRPDLVSDQFSGLAQYTYFGPRNVERRDDFLAG